MIKVQALCMCVCIIYTPMPGVSIPEVNLSHPDRLTGANSFWQIRLIMAPGEHTDID